MSNPLDPIRTAITECDQQLLDILAKRFQLTQQVAETKIANNMQVRDHQREEQLLVKLIQTAAPLGLDAHYVTKLFHVIIEESVLQQQALLSAKANPELSDHINRVAYLGEPGSWSYLAAQKYFTRRAGQLVNVSCESFGEIIEVVETAKADYAILPIENSTSGSINDVYDQLQHTNLHIVGELTYPIEHCLLTLPGAQLSQIKTLFSHPQVLMQCSHYLSDLKDVDIRPADSSSTAMLMVAEGNDPSIAALGSSEGGKLHGLTTLKSNLANQKENHSRFIVVARQPVKVPLQIPAKTTLVLSTTQKPGALVDALMILKNYDLNMTKLESRPILGNPWEEMFYIDIIANMDDIKTQEAIKLLSDSSRYLKVLGCYPSEEVKPTAVSAVQALQD